jgi:hypothetical protein
MREIRASPGGRPEIGLTPDAHTIRMFPITTIRHITMLFTKPEAQPPINGKAPHLQAWGHPRLISLFPSGNPAGSFCFCGSFKPNPQYGLVCERQNRCAIRHTVSFQNH